MMSRLVPQLMGAHKVSYAMSRTLKLGVGLDVIGRTPEYWNAPKLKRGAYLFRTSRLSDHRGDIVGFKDDCCDERHQSTHSQSPCSQALMMLEAHQSLLVLLSILITPTLTNGQPPISTNLSASFPISSCPFPIGPLRPKSAAVKPSSMSFALSPGNTSPPNLASSADGPHRF